MRPVLPRALSLGLAAALCAACASEPDGVQPVMRDFREFRTEVYPVLLRDCGFHACHGAPERFFRVFGPGRARLSASTRAFDLPSGDEVALSYQLSLSMIDGANPPESLLLRKPLALEAGGASHLGADDFGRNVYRSVNDAGYLVLVRWVLGTATPAESATAPSP